MTAWRIGFVLGTTAGGTGRHVAMLASACAAADAEVKVFGPESVRALFEPSPASAAPAPAAPSAEFVAVAITDRPRPASDLAALRLLRRHLSDWRPGVVHAHGLRAGALAALAVLAARSRVPLIVTVHNARPAGARLGVIYGVLERIVARRANIVLCVSPDLSARMRALGARSVERAVVPALAAVPGPALDGQSSAGRASAGRTLAGSPKAGDLAAEGRPIVLGVGRLAPQKGFDLLLEAAAAWRDRASVPLVVIAGDGPLAADLAARAGNLGVDARFLGTRDDVDELLGVADVFVLPSRWEGQPLTLQEALRAGRPIVAADVGGVRDLCGDGGAPLAPPAGPAALLVPAGDPAALLVPAGDPAALGAAVLSVLDDPGLARRLSEAAYARAADLPTEADAVAAAFALYDALGR